MFIKINQATLQQLRFVVPLTVKEAEALLTQRKEIVEYVRHILVSDRVTGIEVNQRTKEAHLVKLPKLGDMLAHTFGGRFRDGALRIPVAPISLKATKAGVKKAMRAAGFKSQGKGLFPAKFDATPVFYVERKVSRNNYEMMEVRLEGTQARPQMVVDGQIF